MRHSYLRRADIGHGRGGLALALGATRLRGRRAYSREQTWGGFGSTTRYDQDTFPEATGTAGAEPHDAPGARPIVGECVAAERRYRASADF
jgi:hypothetical protein